MKSSNILKSMRVKAGMTQDQVAELLNVSRQTYGRLENNPIKIPLNNCFEIIKMLDGNIDDFLFAIKQDYLSQKNKQGGYWDV